MVFLILPLFSAVIEKYIIHNKIEIIRDAVDISAIAVYNSLDVEAVSKNTIINSGSLAYELFCDMLAENLKLDGALNPLEGSVTERSPEIVSIIMYNTGFPLECPEGNTIKRPSVHTVVTVYLKPSLLKNMLLELTGRESTGFNIHIDTEMPVDN